MAGTTLDTNVLLDVLFEDPDFADASEAAIELAHEHGALAVGPVTFAELVTAFARHAIPASDVSQAVRAALAKAGVAVTTWTEDEAATAGLAYERHLAGRDPALVECGACGKRQAFACAKCRRAVAWRSHIMTDFLIGAHALHATGRVLTRDPRLHAKIEGLEVVRVKAR